MITTTASRTWTGTHPAAKKWDEDAADFRLCPDGNRNSDLIRLATRGRSLELSGLFLDGETKEVLLQACDFNQYILTDGYSRVEDIIDRARTHAEDTYDTTMSRSGSRALQGEGATQAIVTPLLSPRSLVTPCTYIAEQIYHSNYSAGYKSVGYYLLAWFSKHRYIAAKYSARAAAASAGVSRKTANQAINAFARDPNINIEILTRGHGTDEPGKIGKTTELILKLDGLPTSPMRRPSVDLGIYVERTQKTDEYIKETQEKNRQKRRDWVKEHDVTTAPLPKKKTPSSIALEEILAAKPRSDLPIPPLLVRSKKPQKFSEKAKQVTHEEKFDYSQRCGPLTYQETVAELIARL